MHLLVPRGHGHHAAVRVPAQADILGAGLHNGEALLAAVVPQAHGAIETGAGKAVAVGGVPGDGVDGGLVALELGRVLELGTLRVPHADVLVRQRQRDAVAGRVPRQPADARRRVARRLAVLARLEGAEVVAGSVLGIRRRARGQRHGGRAAAGSEAGDQCTA